MATLLRYLVCGAFAIGVALVASHIINESIAKTLGVMQ